jgi:hypothetical protein
MNYQRPIFNNIFAALISNSFYHHTYDEHLQYFKDNYYSQATCQKHYNYLSILDNFKSYYGEYPTRKDFFLACKQSCGFLCPYYVTDDEYVHACEFFLSKTGEYVGSIPCDRFYYFVQFNVLERRDPSSTEEFLSFYRRNIIAQTNPESLFENDVIVRPVDREKLGRIQDTETVYEQKGDDKDVCGICQEDFSKGQKYVKLECGHLYHSAEDQCCETGTIFKWFETHRMCPICRKEMV